MSTAENHQESFHRLVFSFFLSLLLSVFFVFYFFAYHAWLHESECQFIYCMVLQKVSVYSIKLLIFGFFIQFHLFNNGYRLNCKSISLYLLVFLMRCFWRFTDYRSASFSLLQHWKLIDFHTFLLFLSNIVKILLIVRFSLESLVSFYVYNHNSSSNNFAFFMINFYLYSFWQ